MPKAIRLEIFNSIKDDIISKLSPYCDCIKIPKIEEYARSMVINVKPKMEKLTGIFGEELILSQDFLNIMYKYGKVTYDTAEKVNIIKFPEDILLKFKIEV